MFCRILVVILKELYCFCLVLVLTAVPWMLFIVFNKLFNFFYLLLEYLFVSTFSAPTYSNANVLTEV